MIKTNFKFKSNLGNNLDVHVYKWEPKNKKNIGVVQLIHGSIEHCLRYERFAKELVKNGYVVYGNDHIGHGESIGSDMFYFSDEDNGMDVAIKDLETLNKIIQNENQNKNIFLFGHSMGSFMLRKLIIDYDISYSGAVICGTGGKKGKILDASIKLLKLDIKNNGAKNRNKLLHSLVYGTTANEFFNIGQEGGFLTKDEDEIKKYLEDEKCGGLATSEYLLELIKLVKWCSEDNSYVSLKKSPLFFISGEKDIIGGIKAGEVKKVYSNYVKNGWINSEIKIYENCKHELLNEINRDEITSDIISFIKQCEEK